MKTISIFLLTASLGLVLPFSAHALDDKEKISMVFEDMHPRSAPSNSNAVPQMDSLPEYGKGCTVAITGVRDLRKNRDTAGGSSFSLEMYANHAPLGMRSVSSGDAAGWLAGAADSLKQYAFVVQRTAAHEFATGTVPAALALRIAHAWNAGMNLNAHIVLEADFTTSNGHVVKRYHGFGAKTNMWNGTGEYMTALNYAMTESMEMLAKDASGFCRGT